AIEVSVTGLNDRTVRILPVYAGKIVHPNELAPRGHLEDYAIYTRPSVQRATAQCCAIKVAVGRLHQSCRIKAVGLMKIVERCQKACRRHLVHRTSGPGDVSVGGRTIEIPVDALDWGSGGVVPGSRGLKAVQRLVACPVGSDFEHRASARRAKV